MLTDQLADEYGVVFHPGAGFSSQVGAEGFESTLLFGGSGKFLLVGGTGQGPLAIEFLDPHSVTAVSFVAGDGDEPSESFGVVARESGVSPLRGV